MMPLALRGGWPVWFIVAVLGSFSPEGRHSSAAEETKETAGFQGHISTVASLAITPDGKTLATGSFDNDIKLWDLATGKERTTLRGHPGGICEIGLNRWK
jgi:WD40 repeat protein